MYRNRLLNFSLLLLSISLLAGCGPTSMVQNALVDPSAPDDGSELFGNYSLNPANGSVKQLFLGSAGKSFPKYTMKAVLVGEDPEQGLGAVTWPVFVRRMKDCYVLHIPLEKSIERLEPDQTERLLKLPLQHWDITGYALLRVKVVPEGLKISSMNDQFWVSQIEQNKLEGTILEGYAKNAKRAAKVTSSREQLVALLEKNLERAFDPEAETLVRLSSRKSE